MILNLNGEFIAAEKANLPLNDGAILFGDTLFETLKAREGRIRFLEDHLDRLQLSAGLLNFPLDRGRVRQALIDTAAKIEAPTGRLRLTVSRGEFAGLCFPPREKGHFFITALPYQDPKPAERQQGVSCVFAPNRRVNPLSHLPQMKRGNYADCLYATNHARHRGAREALFRNENDQVLEGATSNLFLVLKDALITPPAGELVLAGVMRRQVLQAARSQGVQAIERPIQVDELFAAEEVFITNALIDTLPVATLEGRALQRGSWSERLREAIDGLAKIDRPNETT